MYSIAIGNAVPEFDGEHFGWTVERVSNPDAPTFPGDLTGNTNQRSPATMVWHAFVNQVGLQELFFDKYEGLMREPHETRPLSKKHAEAVGTALLTQKQMHPDAVPSFDDDATDTGAGIARLEWLLWWMHRALQECEHPAFEY